jgi:hypothetical protein
MLSAAQASFEFLIALARTRCLVWFVIHIITSYYYHDQMSSVRNCFILVPLILKFGNYILKDNHHPMKFKQLQNAVNILIWLEAVSKL